jgi:DNA-directed RNA polymerase beta subunit
MSKQTKTMKKAKTTTEDNISQEFKDLTISTPPFSYNKAHAFKILESMFKKKSIVSHQIDSFNDFINFGIQSIIDKESTITVGTHEVKFGKIYITKPNITNDNRDLVPIYPKDARMYNLTYDSAVYCDVSESYIEDNTRKVSVHRRVLIARLPIMIKSCVCNLEGGLDSDYIENGECENDPGGYFIVKGHERVLVAQMRAVYNKVFVFKKKEGEKWKYIAEVRSMSDSTGHSVLLQASIDNNDNMFFVFPQAYIKEPIQVGVIFKALGFSPEEIVSIIGLDQGVNEDDKDINPYIKKLQRHSSFVNNKKDALLYIEKNVQVSEEKKGVYAQQIIENEMLPHLGISATPLEQGYFLGQMIKKLILTASMKRKEDDRDNYANKRIETSGILMHDIFRNLFKRYSSTMKEKLQKYKHKPDIVAVMSTIKTISKGIHQCLATGNWGVQKNSYIRTGVSQILDRMTFYSSLSHLRRVIIPIGKEGKNVDMRKIHQSSIFFICPCECFHPDTKILLWNGQVKKAVDVKVGDTLIDDKGFPVKVKSTCSGLKEMYKIKHKESCFEDYIVTDNHILTLIDEDNKVMDVKLQDYLKMGEEKISLRSFKCRQVNWGKVEVDIDELKVSDSGIDRKYIVNDVETRLKVLYKIVKNSGVCLHDKRCFITRRTGSKLLLDTMFLAQSLGYLCTLKNWDNISYTELAIVPTDLYLKSDFVLESLPVQPFVGWQLDSSVKSGRFLLADFTVTHNTPEGQKVGVVLNLAMSCCITRKTDSIILREELSKHISPITNVNNDTRVYLNNALVGFTKNPAKTVKTLRYLRSKNVIDRETSIYFDIVDKDVKLFCDEGRVIRPLLVLENNKIKQDLVDMFQGFSSSYLSWNKLIKKDLIRYVDAGELENSVIAMNCEKLQKQYNDYMEIHPCLMLGVMASKIPFPDHSQSPRNCYSSSMMKQALGVPLLSYNLRTDNVLHVLWYPQRAIVSTKLSELTGFHKMPSGINAIVAIASWAQNQEDSICVNYSSVQKGLFMLTSYHTLECSEKKRETYANEKIGPLPFNDKNFKKKNFYNYSLLDENGIVIQRYKKGGSVYVKVNDVLVGKTVVIEGKNGEKKIEDASLVVQKGEEGYIDKIHIMTTPGGHKLVKIVIRVIREPTLGDKLASTQGQKSTIGMVYRQEDMPWTASGLSPDLIINSCCLSADSLVSLENGKDKPIKEVVEDYLTNYSDDSLLTVNPEKFTLSHTGIHSAFAKKPNNRMLRITTWSGRELCCTEDHMFLVISKHEKNEKGEMIGIWRQARYLVPGIDMLSVCISNDDMKVKVETEYELIRKRGHSMLFETLQKYIKGDCVCVFVEKVEEIQAPSLVYDFATVSENHSFVANSIVVHNCIPSRMTTNLLLETVVGKEALMSGIYGDATPFTEDSVNVADKIVDKMTNGSSSQSPSSHKYNEELVTGLKKYGFSPYGWETMYSGTTGERIEARIFIGPTYYQRLKHMIDDKMHARAKGSVTCLTRQATEGRSQQGGLRYGEQEVQATVAHGASKVLKERMFDLSDKFSISVCKECGTTTNTYEECQMCKGNQIVSCNLPYTSKLTFNLMSAMLLKTDVKPAD